MADAANSASFDSIVSDGNPVKLKFSLRMDYQLIADGASVLLNTAPSNNYPFLVSNQRKNIFVMNTHTFSQEDFDAVGEVLLSPRQLGLLEVPKSWVNSIRSAFAMDEIPGMDALSRVTLQQLSNGSFIVHNYNQEKTAVLLTIPKPEEYIDGFTGNPIAGNGKEIKVDMAPRSRMWFKINNK